MDPKKEIYNDVWFLYKKYLSCPGADEDWENLKKEAQEIVDKHNGDMFAKDLIYAVINELGRVLK